MKNLPKILLLCCALLILSFNNVKANGINSEESNITNNIHSYFDNEMKSIKDFKVHDSEDLISNSDLKDYDKTKNNYYSEWYKGINYKLKSYNIDLTYTNLNISNDTATVTATNYLTMIFENAPNIQQKMLLKYNFVLKKINNKWKIQDIIALNEEKNNNNNIQQLGLNTSSDNKINYKELKEQFSDVQADLNARNDQNEKDKKQSQELLDKSKVNSNQQIKSYSNSNGRYLACTYAQKWAANGLKKRNPLFPDYEDQGGDCTNFVSQCINYGGVGQTSLWYANKNYSTEYWRCVIPFYNWLMNGGVGYESNKSICSRGDVLQFYNSQYQTWHHSALITVKDKTGVYYTCHSYDYVDKNLDSVYPGQYSNCRIIGIRY